MLSATRATSTSTTSRTPNWPLVCRVAVMMRCRRRPAPRAASQMAPPATTAKAISTIGATSGDRPPRKSEIASSGPNSPTAPSAITAMPNGVRRSPESRSTGMIVPSAVEVRAMPMNAAAERSGRQEDGDADPGGERDDPADRRAAERSAADRAEVDLVPGEEEEHREPEVREERQRSRRGRSSRGPPARAAGRGGSRTRRAGSRPSTEGPHEQRRRDRDRRDEHQRADRDVHDAPPDPARTHVRLPRC